MDDRDNPRAVDVGLCKPEIGTCKGECKRELELTRENFNPSKSNRSGFQGQCRACMNKKQRERNAEKRAVEYDGTDGFKERISRAKYRREIQREREVPPDAFDQSCYRAKLRQDHSGVISSDQEI